MLATGVAVLTVGVLGVLSHLFIPTGVDPDNLLPVSLACVVAGAVLLLVAISRY